MIIKNYTFQIDHHGDGTARVQLQHGGDTLTMDMTSAERQTLGLLLLDPHTPNRAFDETG